MKKSCLLTLLLLWAIKFPLCAQDIVGLWKTIDEKTGLAQSIVAIYQYQDKYYGRIIETFTVDGNILDSIADPKDKAPRVKGNPYYSGLDIMWGLKKSGSRFTNGKIMDPKNGKIYGAEIWREGNNLIVRGKILFLGRNQTWIPVSDNDFPPGFQKPDLSALVPVLYDVN